MVLVFGLIFRGMFKAEINVTDYVYMVVGIASTLVFFLNLERATVPLRFNHMQDIGDGSNETMLSIIGFVSFLGLLFAGLSLLSIPLNITGLPPEAYAIPVQKTMSYVFIADILCLVGAMICMNAWSKYIVKEGCFVLTGEKVLYPGDRYRIWQWEDHMPQAVPEKFSVEMDSLEILSKNEEKPVDVEIITSAKVDIGKAKKLGITNIDLPIVRRDAETKLSLAIKKQASSIAFADLFRGVLTPEEMIIAGVPIIWDGKVRVSSVEE